MKKTLGMDGEHIPAPLPAIKGRNMNFTKSLWAAAAALALMAFASTASATTLEVGGATKNEKVTIHATTAGSVLWTDTFGGFANTCTVSTIESTTTTPFTNAARIGGPIPFNKLVFESCTEDTKEKVVVDAAGYLTIEAISGTTNGTVFSDSTKVTTPSPFGKLTCTTAAAGTDIGKLTGVAAGNATLDISAALNCGIITGKWGGTYTVTSPPGLGVEA
jgi:hypothetical protein